MTAQPVLAQPVTLSDKKATANQVLEQIGAAYGYSVLELPKLVMHARNKNNRRIAYLEMIALRQQQSATRMDRSRLFMDEELFDICMALDIERARRKGTTLSFVLSHEIAHFYHRHNTYRSFADLNIGVMPETLSRQQESQADQTGLLFAYLAGYNPEPMLDALFDAIYTHYRLDDKLWGYPTKSERQQNAKLRATEFSVYGHLFALGQALYCREQFPEAARCFEYVFTRYPLKEAYNNFGVCRLQQLTRFRKKDNISYFALPFEVDPHNRLLGLSERSGTVTSSELASWSKEADAAFTRAIELDVTYKQAYLNQSIGALLANNTFLVLGILTTMTQKTGQPLPPNGHLIKGMAYAAMANWPNVQQCFDQPGTQRAYQIAYNKLVAQAIRQHKLVTLRKTWQRLQTRPSAPQLLYCQTKHVLLQEIDQAPASVRWPGNYLMELTSDPPPFISVDSKQVGKALFFRVKMGDSLQPLYFVRQL
ncbi:hypothetical protein EQG79_09275 [Spirosoma sordidisoli]|uniref:Peptidase M48 domain-containing protein n=1 Tax=Spirosoma sordidisoli TaxID=2502893 RepID=A0A4Q2UQH1_9BACT|nr:hypothetical protein EQG79_09275 [Spirosoma sordidisoli]